jgi:hypothetical protein
MAEEEYKDEEIGDIEVNLPEDDEGDLGELGPDEFMDGDEDVEGMNALGLHVVTGDEFVEEEEGY